MILTETLAMPPRHQSLWMVALFALALFALAFDEAVADQHTPVFDIVAFGVDTETDVANDLMSVTLVAQDKNADAAVLADTINQRMQWAVDKLTGFPAIRTETLGYQTWPQYETGGSRRIIGWSGSQSLQLDTEDFEMAGKAIQVLQERLQVQGMQLSAQRITRKAAEQELIDAALAAFRERAERIQKAMGADSYRVLDIDVSSNDGGGVPVQARGMAMEASSARSVAAPQIEAGTSAVQVRIDGRIQLQ